MKRKKLQKVTLPEELKEALKMAEERDKVRDYFKSKRPKVVLGNP